MRDSAVIKDAHFDIVVKGVSPDAKKRVGISKVVKEDGVTYDVYVNRLGQIVLDPQKSIPAYEAWLWENPVALAAVRKGLAESRAGRVRYLGSFAKHAKDA